MIMVTSFNRTVDGSPAQDDLNAFPETVSDLRYRADFTFYVIEVETGLVRHFLVEN